MIIKVGNINAYIFNVFTGPESVGNPAAVVALEGWVPEKQLQSISILLAQPVTSFLVGIDGGYQIRWFAGDTEINLCGHGSLAAAAALFEIKPSHENQVRLFSQHGDVIVNKVLGGYSVQMPAWKAKRNVKYSDLASLIGITAIDAFSTRDLVFVLKSEEEVRSFVPDFDVIKRLSDFHALIVTARLEADGDLEGSGYALRYFAPNIGINEDIATGSAQCSLAPYWIEQLSQQPLVVKQLSDLGGYFQVSQSCNERVEITAHVSLSAIEKLAC